MNKRMKQLAEQAGCKVMDDGEWYIPSAVGSEKVVYTSGVGLEKFAELIVRECIRIPYDMWDKAELNADTAVKIEHRIKQHFGVEE